jgi:hypothetical protein
VCARGDGIRGSKDLRAEFGKYSNSTNERKQMSKKTIKQRIALVAATAMGASVISVLTLAPARAEAASVMLRDDYTAATTFVTNENVGVCWVASTSADNDDLTNGVEMLSTGRLKLTGTSTQVTAANNIVSFAISGPASWVSWTEATTSGGAGTLSATGKTLSFTGTTINTNEKPTKVIMQPTGVGTVQITISEYVAASTSTTQIEVITVQVKSTCASGSVSVADTFTRLVTDGTKGNQIAYATGTSIDTTDANYASNTGAIYVRMDAYDVNGTLISGTTSATGTVTAEVSSGAFIGNEGTGTTASVAVNDKSTWFKVTQATDDVPWKGTITLKINGNVVATKSARIHGVPASIEISGLDIPAQDGNATTIGDYVIKDSAGNALDVAISGTATLTEKQGSILGSFTNTRTPSQTAARVSNATDKGTFAATCTSSYGPGATATGLKLRYTNAALVSIYSPEFSITCGESSYTYTASLDKASYVPGDVATLTVESKGAFGNVVKDGQALSTQAAGISIAGSNMTAVIAPTVSDTFTGGKKTYKFIVGTTEGSYNLVVDLTSLNSSSKPQSAVTIPYKIASGVTTVSNADVLKSIVALIASINKQIQALQKLILKR